MKLPPLTEVKSSNVEAIGHAGDRLFVRFKSGHTYSYEGVPASLYHEGLQAESPGRWFREHVRGKYRHKQHDA